MVPAVPAVAFSRSRYCFHQSPAHTQGPLGFRSYLLRLGHVRRAAQAAPAHLEVGFQFLKNSTGMKRVLKIQQRFEKGPWNPQAYSDEKVANRDIRVWHGATENGP
jgi:hypothetical protein